MVLPNFKENLEKYAKLLVANGINVQPGHTLALNIDVEQRELAHLIVKEAYALGAHEVIIQWADDFTTREKFLHAPMDRLDNVPDYKIAEMNYLLEHKASRLGVRSSDPGALNGVEPEKLSASAKALGMAMKPMRIATQSNKVSWTVAAAAGLEWAKKVFPNAASDEEAVDLLWDQIFKTCRVYEEDPVKAWEEHAAILKSKADMLNKEQFSALHYSAPGTDLILGLPKNHVWESAGAINAQGEGFLPNMPTEEVFTSPMKGKCEGRLVSTKPLSRSGQVIDHFTVNFKDGRVVDCHAEQGEEVLKKMFAMDEGASMLGEVALVPKESPINQSGLMFYNTLFDENACCHVAAGRGFSEVIEGFMDMTDEEIYAKGINDSMIHMDFMVGSDDLHIVGIREDGSEVDIFVDGTWAE